MKVVHFQVEHLWHLEVDLTHNLDGRPLLADQDERVIEILTGEAWSLEHLGRIVACGGRTGLPELGYSWWLLCEREALRHKLSLTRAARDTLREHAKPGDIAHALDETAHHWLQVLGFEPTQSEEGVMRFVWPG